MEVRTERRIDPRKLAGLLSDEKRLRVAAALALGARTPPEIRQMTGLDNYALAKSIGQLMDGGLIVSETASSYRLRHDVFEEAARGDRANGSDAIGNLARNGRLPRSRAERVSVLEELAGLFEPNRRYPEAEVNDRLRAVNPDFALLRRYLVDEGFMKRETQATGSRMVMFYWRAK